MVELLAAAGECPVNIDKKSEAEAAAAAAADELELLRWFTTEDEEELDEDRFWPVGVEAAGGTEAPNQSKGLAKGLTALRFEEGVAVALSGGLNMVAAAAAAAE